MKNIISLFALVLITSCGLQVRDNPFTTNNPNTNNPNGNGASFTVGGQASGIPVRKDVKVTIAGQEFDITNGNFTFPIQFDNNDPYNVDIVEGPGGAYSCTLENDSGTIPNANVTNVLLNCSCAVGSLGTGTGTANDPVLVYTAIQLNDVAIAANFNQLGLHYKQVCDLDYGDLGPKPIGQESNPFAGEYDGNDFFILNYTSGLNVASLDRRKGLFGYVWHARLKNIRLKDFNLTADANMGTTQNPAHMGALAGTAEGANIDHIYAENISLNNNGSYFHGLGGLIGNQIKLSFSGVTNTLEFVHMENVDIVGGISNKVAGVVGWTQVDTGNIEIANSHIHSCAYRCGGVVGAIFNKASFSDINALNLIVEGNEAVGGIAGESIGVINRAGFIGTINGLTNLGDFGGVIGKGNGSDPTLNSYTVSDILSLIGTTDAGRINGSAALIQNVGYDSTQTCQNCTVNSGTAYNGNGAFQAGTHASQVSWDFINTWCTTDTYPRLTQIPYPAACVEPVL